MRTSILAITLLLIAQGAHAKPCTQERTATQAGDLSVESCVLKQHAETYGNVAKTSRVRLLFTPKGGRAATADLGDVDEHWEWEQHWKVAGTLADATGRPAVAVVVLTSSDVAFEWRHIQLRALDDKLTLLWESKDDLYESELVIKGPVLQVRAKHIAPKANLDEVFDKTPTTELTLTYRDGRIVASSAPAQAAAGTGCAAFNQVVAKTYGFRVATLSADDRKKRLEGMDRFWEETKAKRVDWVPCLRAALADPKRDRFFAFDGAQLLASLADTPADRRIVRQAYLDADLVEVSLQPWVEGIARLGFNGADTSSAGLKWLALKDPQYMLAAHATMIGKDAGAWFIFGSMDERFATPALLRAIDGAAPDVRPIVLSLLMRQQTPAANQALARASLADLPKSFASELEAFRAGKWHVTPRQPAKLDRARVIAALNDYLKGTPDALAVLEHSEPDMVAVLTKDDAPLVRKVRRMLIAHCSPHVAELADGLSRVLYTLTGGPAR